MSLGVRLSCPLALLALVALPAGALAAPVVSHSSFRGDIAEAGFFGGDGCTSSVVGVTASDGSSFDEATGRRRGPSVQVHIGLFDTCSGRSLHDISADVELAAGQFSVDSGLAVAALQASVPAYDQATGQSVVLELHLTWTATSAAGMARSVSMTTYPDGSRQLTRADGQMREAIASGTVSVDSIDVAAGVATLADLQSVHDGSLVRSSR